MFDFSDFDFSDFSSLGDMFGGGGFDMGSMAGGGSTGGWDYWIKAIQDGVIGQSAGFDAVKQNQESEPLAMEARGEDPKDAPARGETKGDYVYNLENDMPFLADMYKGFAGTNDTDDLRTQGSSGVTNKGQNNASGSNASLDKSLNPEARKVLGVSEGGATPQLNAGDTSFNSMMDSFGDMHLPLDTPKERQELFGKDKKKGESDKSFDDVLNTFKKGTTDDYNALQSGASSGVSFLDNLGYDSSPYFEWLNKFGGY